MASLKAQGGVCASGDFAAELEAARRVLRGTRCAGKERGCVAVWWRQQRSVGAKEQAHTCESAVADGQTGMVAGHALCGGKCSWMGACLEAAARG